MSGSPISQWLNNPNAATTDYRNTEQPSCDTYPAQTRLPAPSQDREVTHKPAESSVACKLPAPQPAKVEDTPITQIKVSTVWNLSVDTEVTYKLTQLGGGGVDHAIDSYSNGFSDVWKSNIKVLYTYLRSERTISSERLRLTPLAVALGHPSTKA